MPYYTRREIDEGRLLEGREIAWLSDPFEAYVISVQGSAKLRLADGSIYELGYAGNSEDYYDPRNSSLSDVLDRRRGIPITLSVLHIEVGRRAGDR